MIKSSVLFALRPRLRPKPTRPVRVLAIDPGCTESAYVLYDATEERIDAHGKVPNEEMRSIMRSYRADDTIDDCAIEMVACYGMPVGAEVFETCLMIGQLMETWRTRPALVYRREVKLHLCGNVRANDSNIRQALIDRFGAPGTKKTPGATYGITKDCWQALGVAVTYADGV